MRLTADAAFGVDYDNLTKLLGLAGPFWQNFYQGQESLRAVLETTRQQYRQNLRRLTELASLADYKNPPVYHTETFYPLYVPVDKVTRAPLRYGDGAQYGNADGPQLYGQKDFLGWALPVPGKIKSALLLLDRPENSRFSATLNFSMWFDGDSIEMKDDPASVFTVVDYNGEPSYLVWLYMADIDENYLTSRYGPLYNNSFTSASPQALAIRHATHALLQGPSEYSLRGLLAAAVGDPVADRGEKVEQILDGYNRFTVITSKRTVHSRDGSSPVVEIGETLRAGDFFFDSVQLAEPLTFPEWLTQVRLHEGLTGGDAVVLPAGEINATAETRDEKLYVYPTDLGDGPLWQRVNTSQFPLGAAVLQEYGISVADELTASPSTIPSAVDFASVLFGRVFGSKLSVSLLSSAHLVPGAVEILRLIRPTSPPWVHHLIEFTDEPPVGWLNNAEQCC